LILLQQLKKGKLMSDIITAIKVREASENAIHDPLVILMGKQLLSNIELNNKEAIMESLFEYSSILSAICATNVTSAILTKGEFSSMVKDMREFDEITRSVLDE
jgi:hypothetical protein